MDTTRTVPSRRSAALGLCVLFLAACGCAQTPSTPPLRGQAEAVAEKASLVFGRLRIIENGQETKWGVLFDRPTPELYHVQTERFISRIALTGGLFTEAFERDGTFCWTLTPGTYLISRIVPWQGNVTTADDPRKNIFPGIAFQAPEGADAIYLGTLSISVPARKDFMGNKWLTGPPSVRVLDEFEQDQGIPKNRDAGFSGRVEKRLMLWRPALEMKPPYQSSTLWPILNALPWPLLMHR